MLENDDDLGKLEVFRARLRHSLPARFLLRFHLTLIVTASIFLGWLVDVVLLHKGVRSMIARYPIVILVSYGVFIAGIGAWLRYSGIADCVNRYKARYLIGDNVRQASRGARVVPDPSGIFDPTGGFWGEGCLLAVLAIVVFLAFGGYTIMTAPAFFADVVIELLLAAGLLHGVKRAREAGWVSGVVANTWGSPVVAFLLAFIAWMLARAYHPQPATLGELWFRLHRH